MNFAGEFRQHWKALLAATLGLAMGLSIQGYINSIFAPHLLKSFQWSRADFALTSMVSSVAILCIPIAGRLTDRLGVRPVATIGMAVFPLTFIGMSLMTGSIYEYVAYNVIQLAICVTTSATVYSRIVAERFTAARGTALAVLTCGPALSGALLSPVLGSVVAEHGWRTGYLLLALLLGVVALIVRRILPQPGVAGEQGVPARSAKELISYPALARSRSLWILLIAGFLCSL